ncbi:hypothetical protein SOVF_171450 [Spinacia oleracea]|nr:hypothetical protein SOVF_171450 [Spinacia oleracea]
MFKPKCGGILVAGKLVGALAKASRRSESDRENEGAGSRPELKLVTYSRNENV